MTNHMASMAPFQPSELYPMMVAALITNKPEFVKLFLENGVQLKEFVSQATLFYLYQNLEPTCLFHCKLDRVLGGEPERLDPGVLLQRVAQVLRELLGDSTQLLYSRPHSSDQQRLFTVPSVKISVSAGQLWSSETQAIIVTGKVGSRRHNTDGAGYMAGIFFSLLWRLEVKVLVLTGELLVRPLLLACRGPRTFWLHPHGARYGFLSSQAP